MRGGPRHLADCIQRSGHTNLIHTRIVVLLTDHTPGGVLLTDYVCDHVILLRAGDLTDSGSLPLALDGLDILI